MSWPYPRHRRGLPEPYRESQGVSSLGSFGWFYAAPPSWWPVGPRGPRGKVLLAAFTRLRFSYDPRLRAAISAANLLNAGEPVDLGNNWWNVAGLRPATSELAAAPDFADAFTPAGLCGGGHEAYVRILHGVRTRLGTGIRWRDLPDARLQQPGWRPDRRADGGIVYDWGQDDGHTVHELVEGGIPEPERSYIEFVLLNDLGGRGFEGDVVQAWWNGFGGSNLPDATPVRLHQPERELVPFLIAMSSFIAIDVLESRTPAVVFPSDLAWVLANDIDLVSTYVGCSRELAEAFLQEPGLEVQLLSPDDPLG